MSRGNRAFLAAFIVLGTLARMAPIAANRFHEDEAVYSHWALLVATGRDVLLKKTPVDKPPLFVYMLALFFKMFGHSEVTARLPSLLLSIASIPLVYHLSSHLHGEGVALASAAIMAFSPFNILFAPTAFTDPPMVAFVLASFCFAVRGNLWWAGFLLGLASATKQQGLFFAPLSFALAFLRRDWGESLPRGCFRFILGLLAAIVPVILWDSTRWRTMPSYIEQSLKSYGGLSLAEPAELLKRLKDWANILSYITASPFLNALSIASLSFLMLHNAKIKGKGALFDFALAGFIALFLLTHWLLSFNVWDRYVLGLVPLVAILLARGLLLAGWAISRFLFHQGGFGRADLTKLVVIFLIASLAWPAWKAMHSDFPIGGDHGAYQGIEHVADYFRDVQDGAILYHRWLGWHYSFYMFDFPLDFRWYSSPEELAEKAAEVEGVPLYIVFPSWKSSEEVRASLEKEGLALRCVRRIYRKDGSVSFTIYRIEEL